MSVRPARLRRADFDRYFPGPGVIGTDAGGRRQSHLLPVCGLLPR